MKEDIFDRGIPVVNFDWERFRRIPNYVPPTGKPMPLPPGEHLTKTPSEAFGKYQQASIWNQRWTITRRRRRAA